MVNRAVKYFLKIKPRKKLGKDSFQKNKFNNKIKKQ